MSVGKLQLLAFALDLFEQDAAENVITYVMSCSGAFDAPVYVQPSVTRSAVAGVSRQFVITRIQEMEMRSNHCRRT